MTKKQNRQFPVRLLELIYSPLGIFFDPTSQKYFLVLVLAIYMFFVPLTLYYEIVALLVDTTAPRASTIAYILFTVLFTILVLATQLKRARWLIFYQSVKTLLVDQYLNDEVEALLKAKKNQLIFFFGVLNSIFIFPVLNICTAAVELGSYETLLLSTMYPWPANTPLWYTITIIFQCCSVSILSLCIVGNFSFVYYFRALITSLNAALKKKITQLITSSSMPTQEQRDREDMNGLRDIIRSHRDLTRGKLIFQRFGNQYRSLAAPYTHLCIMVFLGSGVFIVSSLLWVKNNLLYRLKLMNLQMTISYQLLFVSSVGQILDEMNTQVLGHIYDIDWFEKSIEFRKEMITFMTFLQRQQHVKVFKVRVLNWVFVASIVRTTYSMLQVFMRIMQN